VKKLFEVRFSGSFEVEAQDENEAQATAEDMLNHRIMNEYVEEWEVEEIPE